MIDDVTIRTTVIEDWPARPARVSLVAPAQVTGASRLAIRLPSRQVFIPIDEIIWIEADRNNVIVHGNARSIMIRTTLADLESSLPAEMFVRIHRSAIVNIDRVEEIRKTAKRIEIHLAGGACLTANAVSLERLESLLAAV